MSIGLTRLESLQRFTPTKGDAAILDQTISPVDLGRTIFQYSYRGANGSPNDSSIRGSLTSTTNLRLEAFAATASDDTVFHAEVMQFSGMRVQHYTVNDMTDGQIVNILPVDRRRAFLIMFGMRKSGSTFGTDDMVRISFNGTSNSQVQLNAFGAASGMDIAFAVVEADCRVQEFTVNVTTTATSFTQNILPVDPRRTRLFGSAMESVSGAGFDGHLWRMQLAADGKSFSGNRNVGDSMSLRATVYVVEFRDACVVQRGTNTQGSGTTQSEVPITPVDRGSSCVRSLSPINGWSAPEASITSNDWNNSFCVSAFGGNGSTVTFQRDAGASSTVVNNWEVVTWRRRSPFPRLPTTIAAIQVAAGDPVDITITGQGEALARVAVANAGQAEALAGVGITLAGQAESLAGVAATLAGELEALGRVSAGLVGQAEALGRTAIVLQGQAEALAGVQITATGQIEALDGVVAGYQGQAEALAGVLVPLAGQIEALGQEAILITMTGQIEALGRATATLAGQAEALERVSPVVLAGALEALAGVQATLRGQIEATGIAAPLTPFDLVAIRAATALFQVALIIEDVTYYVLGQGDGVALSAVIDRSGVHPEPLPFTGGRALGTELEVFIPRPASIGGIPVVTPHRDQVAVPILFGAPPTRCLVVGIVDSDPGKWHLRVQA